MKRIVVVSVLIALALSLCACSDGSHYRGESAEEKRAEARIEEEVYKYEQRKEMYVEIKDEVLHDLEGALKYDSKYYIEVEELLEAFESYADSDEEAEDMRDCILSDVNVVTLYDVYKEMFDTTE